MYTKHYWHSETSEKTYEITFDPRQDVSGTIINFFM